MSQKKYYSFHYWQNLIQKNDRLLEGFFRDVPMTRDSVIVHSVLADCHQPPLASWDSFPNADGVIGFLKFVFLPTAYVAWCARDDGDNIVIVDAPAEAYLDFFEASEDCKYKETIPLMREELRQLDELWDFPSEEKIERLREFGKGLQEKWDKTKELFFYCDVYASAEEVSCDIMAGYEEVDMLHDFEKEIGMSKEAWLDLARHVYDNEFMRRKFTDMLNNNVQFVL